MVEKWLQKLANFDSYLKLKINTKLNNFMLEYVFALAQLDQASTIPIQYQGSSIVIQYYTKFLE